MNRDKINEEIKRLDQLYNDFFEGKKPVKMSGESVECTGRLLVAIRSYPDHLTTLRPQYIDVMRLHLRSFYLATKYEQAIVEGNRLLDEIGEDDSVAFAKLLRQLGGNHMQLGQYAEAVDYCHKAYQLFATHKVDDKTSVSVANVMSLVYGRLGQLEDAIKWALKVMAVQKSHNMMGALQFTMSNLCILYYEFGDYEQAIQCGEQGIEILELNQAGMGYVYNNVANVWVAMLQLDKAERYYEKGLAYNQGSKDKLGILYALRGLGKVALKRRRFDESVTFLSEALSLAEKIKSHAEIYATCDLLAEAYDSMGKHKEALSMYRRFHEAYEAVYDQNKQETLYQLEVKHRTEIAQIEARQLRIENEALEEVVAEKTAEVVKALEQSERTNVVRSNILKTIMHEFRTPLTVVSSSSGLLKRHSAKMSAEKKEQMHTRITDSIQYLSRLLDEVSKVENSSTRSLEPQFSTVAIGKWSKKLVDQLRPETADPANVTYVFDAADEREIEIDTEMTKTIVSELLLNALKYTPDGKPITVEIGVDETEVVVTVADEGVGIAADEIDNIYELFYRAYKAGDIAGLGTGLYVVKMMVDQLGGTIVATSGGANAGSTFTLRLPV